MEQSTVLCSKQHQNSFVSQRYYQSVGCALAAVVLVCAFSGYAQVFRGYSSSGTMEFNARQKKRSEVIKGFYPDGKLEFTATYRRGKLDGVVKEYYENGMLKAEIPYEDGMRDGTAKFYHDNGMLMCKVYYEDDTETGRAKFYDRNGLLSTSVNTEKNRVRQSRRFERQRTSTDKSDTSAPR